MKWLFVFAFLLSFFAFFANTLAHDVNFLEYAPDPFNSQRLTAGNLTDLAQIFQLTGNVTLTGFDFWLDNLSSAGSVTFNFRDHNNTFLTTKTVTVPSLGAVAGGNKFHIDLDSPMALNTKGPYTIEIQSSLVGLGIYHAKRTAYLEHNQAFVSPYLQGVARINSDEQLFSLKYALYRLPAGSEASNFVPPEAPPAPNDPLSITITNARVAQVTATTALLAWTTNIAADSRVTIRTQLNPYYVYTSGFDPTWELEHAVLVTGLIPEVNYFADVFSAQGESLLLTTYTIGFQTPEGSLPAQPAPSQPQAPAPPAPAPAPVAPTQTAAPQAPIQNEPIQSGQSSPTSPEAGEPGSLPTSNNPAQTSQTAENQSAGSSENLSTPTISSGEREGNFSLNWTAPAAGEPADGYRLDIFDEHNNLERQIYVESGVHSKEVGGLPAGSHRAIIYANNGGVFTKIAAPFSFIVKSRVNLKIFLGLGSIIFFFVGGSALAIWRFKKEKSPLPTIEE